MRKNPVCRDRTHVPTCQKVTRCQLSYRGRPAVIATEETTVTQQVNHRPINCQSRLWSQRGKYEKVNGSHHGDKDPNRDKKLCGSTSDGTDQYQNGSSNLLTPYRVSTSIDSECCSLPTTSVLRQKPFGKITLQPVLINKSKFLKVTHCTEIRKTEIPRSMVVEALSW